jgi:phenylalanyl-tRNA synthetase alpha subunit
MGRRHHLRADATRLALPGGGAGRFSRKIVGWAFGFGIERIAMRKYGISNIRQFVENDVRFLRQF